ncbi:hypothetical protein ACF1BB_18860 [Streptomyces griseoluteus]
MPTGTLDTPAADLASATASNIRDGWVQVCPWGNYKVYLEFAGADGLF